MSPKSADSNSDAQSVRKFLDSSFSASEYGICARFGVVLNKCRRRDLGFLFDEHKKPSGNKKRQNLFPQQPVSTSTSISASETASYLDSTPQISSIDAEPDDGSFLHGQTLSPSSVQSHSTSTKTNLLKSTHSTSIINHTESSSSDNFNVSTMANASFESVRSSGPSKSPIPTILSSQTLPSKDRFNYASFDCGAVVKNSNPDATSAKSILSDNQDSYMLNKCASPNKFVIIEVCQEILIDRIVIANMEYFSSMFMNVRVKISDRYPPKQWRDLALLQAKDHRGLQSFNIRKPLIWAKYIKLEFLSWFGNEYFCPVTLVRVYGSTVMEDLRNEIDFNPLGEDQQAYSSSSQTFGSFSSNDKDSTRSNTAGQTSKSGRDHSEHFSSRWKFRKFPTVYPKTPVKFVENEFTEFDSDYTAWIRDSGDISGDDQQAGGIPIIDSPRESLFKLILKQMFRMEARLNKTERYLEDGVAEYHKMIQETENDMREQVEFYLDDLTVTVLSGMREMRNDFDKTVEVIKLQANGVSSTLRNANYSVVWLAALQLQILLLFVFLYKFLGKYWTSEARSSNRTVATFESATRPQSIDSLPLKTDPDSNPTSSHETARLRSISMPEPESQSKGFSSPDNPSILEDFDHPGSPLKSDENLVSATPSPPPPDKYASVSTDHEDEQIQIARPHFISAPATAQNSPSKGEYTTTRPMKFDKNEGISSINMVLPSAEPSEEPDIDEHNLDDDQNQLETSPRLTYPD